MSKPSKVQLQRLCGDYRLLKHELVKKKIQIIRAASRLNLVDQIFTQMEW